MTREEEIRQAAAAYILEMHGEINEDSDVAEGFREGAKWADKTMIEKACKWLINIDFDGDRNFRDCDESFNNDLLVDAFRKAMKL